MDSGIDLILLIEQPGEPSNLFEKAYLYAVLEIGQREWELPLPKRETQTGRLPASTRIKKAFLLTRFMYLPFFLSYILYI